MDDMIDLGGWDMEEMFNFRDWLKAALTEAGATDIDGGGGLGGCDLRFKIDGAPFYIEAKPVIK